MLDHKTVAQVAELARVEMDEAELQRMVGQLDAILRHAAKLDEVQTTGVIPTAHTLDAVNALREDLVQDSLPRPQALGNAPEHNDEAFVVPRVLS